MKVIISLPTASETELHHWVDTIMVALYASEPIVGAILDVVGSAGLSGVGVPSGYVSTRDLQEANQPIPVGIPLFIPEIGGSSVHAPSTKIVQSVLSKIEGLPLSQIRVYHAVEYEAQDTASKYKVHDAATLARELRAQGTPPCSEIADLLDVQQVVPWGVERVRASQAWDHGFRGKRVRVAIVDTGYGAHPDLPVPVATEACVPGNASVYDDAGHGTHVAGIALALDNGWGVVGVAPDVEWVAVKVLDEHRKCSDDIAAEGIIRAVNHRVQVINLSWGGKKESSAVNKALAYANANGVVACASAGNFAYQQAVKCQPVKHPASSPLTIAVASCDINDQHVPSSCCGPELDVTAPGDDILSTLLYGADYGCLSGTSMAAPHVTGVVALLLSQQKMPPHEVKARLKETARGLGDPHEFGAGVVQADAALRP